MAERGGFSLCGDHTRKIVHCTIFSPNGEHANKFARSLFKSRLNSTQKAHRNWCAFCVAERGGILPLVKGKANFSLRGVCALLRVARRANLLNVATQKAPYIKGALAWRREGDLNPRYAYDVYTISNRAHSTTLTSLHILN